MSNQDFNIFSGDDVHLTSDPSVKGRVSYVDSSYAFVRIGSEILPFKFEDLALDKNRPLGIGLFLLSAGIFAALCLWIFGV